MNNNTKEKTVVPRSYVCFFKKQTNKQTQQLFEDHELCRYQYERQAFLEYNLIFIDCQKNEKPFAQGDGEVLL